MDKDKLLGKIKGLLNKAKNNPSEHEAQAATAHAYRLMMKYNILESEVKGIEETPEYDHGISLTFGKREPKELELIGAILDNYFLVRCGIKRVEGNKVSVIFFGDKHNAEIARHTYQYLSDTYKKLFVARRLERFTELGLKIDKRKMEPSRRPYYEGLTLGLHEKLTAQKKEVEQECGLVPVQTGLKEYMDNTSEGQYDSSYNKNKSQEASPSESSWMSSGYRDAEKVDFNPALENAEQKTEGQIMAEKLRGRLNA